MYVLYTLFLVIFDVKIDYYYVLWAWWMFIHYTWCCSCLENWLFLLSIPQILFFIFQATEQSFSWWKWLQSTQEEYKNTYSSTSALNSLLEARKTTLKRVVSCQGGVGFCQQGSEIGFWGVKKVAFCLFFKLITIWLGWECTEWYADVNK